MFCWYSTFVILRRLIVFAQSFVRRDLRKNLNKKYFTYGLELLSEIWEAQGGTVVEGRVRCRKADGLGDKQESEI